MKSIQARVRHRLPRQVVSILATAAAVGLSGCASPYVTLEKRTQPDDAKPMVLASAISDARNVQSQYRAKVLELGEAERALSNSLLGLGTLVVGLAVANVHSSAVNGVVLGTGAIYTIGTFNTDKRRARVYIAGMKAIDCAVDAVTPLILNEDLMSRLGTSLTALDGEIKALGAAIGNAEAWSAQARLNDAGKFQAVIDATTLALAAAQVSIAQADAATDLATQRLSRPHQIAKDLSNAVSSIDRAVLDEIRGTENAVQAVPVILAGLQSNAALFSLQSLAPNLVAQPAGTSSTEEKAGVLSRRRSTLATANVAQRDRETLGGLTAALGEIRFRTVVVASRAERLSKAATAKSAQSVADGVKGCEVQGVVKNIVATPTAVTFAAKTAIRQSIMVDGGNGNYTVAFLQAPVPGVTAVIPPRSRGVVEIVATDQTVAGGSYQLLIEDTTQTSRQVVTVAIGAAPVIDDKNTSSKNSKQDAAIDQIKKASPLKINGATVTLSKVTPQDDGVKVEYTTTTASVTDDQVREAVMSIDDVKSLIGMEVALFTVGKAQTDEKSVTLKKKTAKAVDGGPVVGALDVSERRRVQIRLCMPADKIKDSWSDDAQAALRYDREHRRGGVRAPAPAEPLNDTEKAALLALDDAKAAARCKRP